jgi:hypothetical protein
MNEDLRQLVWTRAASTCEYCRMPQEFDRLPFGLDHIRPQYHDGPTTAENLALACFNCNTFKGTNVAGYDPVTNEVCRLFSPRADVWQQHFRWDGPLLKGLTPIGRTTTVVLRINVPERAEHRRLLIASGSFHTGAP